MTHAERFWAKVAVGAADDCWEWAAFRQKKMGYGRWHPSKHGPSVGAHREAWRLTHGEIPQGLCVLHRCDNPPCCNPAHLWLGTITENNADMRAKKREGLSTTVRVRGEANSQAKLTEAQVRSALDRHAKGAGAFLLAREFGVNRSTMRRILRRQKWTHVSAVSSL